MKKSNEAANAAIAMQRQRFLEGLPLLPEQPVRHEILRSWQRSRAAGVKSDDYRVNILSKKDLDRLERKCAPMLETALPVIDMLHSTILHSQTNILLTDDTGVILHSMGTGQGFSPAPACGIRGIDNREDREGTTAIGICLSERRAVHVTGAEHYKRVYDEWHCSVAPVFDPHGELMGAVGFVINRHELHPHTFGLVAAAATLITDQIKLRMLLQNQSAIFDSLNEGVIVLDKNSRVMDMNPHACKLFRLKKAPTGKHASSIVINEDVFSGLHERSPVSDQEALFTLVSGKQVRCTLSAERTSAGGLIINLRENARMQHFAKRFLGSKAKYTFRDILGESSCMRAMLEMARNASSSGASVLILGESGVGKELIAQAIHNSSPRREGPFIALNCGAIPRDLVQTELFGYEPGAFTGASRNGMLGKFELADGGTLFLDEIGDMALNVQVHLLRVLQEGIVTRVGGKKQHKIDVRVIAATHRNLFANVGEGSFRRDLYYRLNVLSLNVPPLRERGDDIALLAHFFLLKYREIVGKKIDGIVPQVMERLSAYHWPGNVRELENIIERAVIVTTNSSLQLGDLPMEMLAQPLQQSQPLRAATSPQVAVEAAMSHGLTEHNSILREHEAGIIKEVLMQTDGNIRAAALKLGISRGTLYARLRRYGIHPAALRR